VSGNIPNKYYWTRDEEAKLLELWKKGVTYPAVLAKQLGRQPLGIQRKLERMGVVVGLQKSKTTTTIDRSCAAQISSHFACVSICTH